MGLVGWNENQKLMLTIDSSKVDEDLTNFPVNITLSSGTGQTDFDVTNIFDELGSYANRKKIALTDSSDDQLYTEIERWDHNNEEANLWVKVPTIASGIDTELYLYYDATTSGNTSYVGDTGETPAQNVWDSNFKGVWHMAQDPNGDVADVIKDSTSNINHGTPAGAMTTADLVDGKIGKAIDFEGTDDCIDTGHIFVSETLTTEIIIYPNAVPGSSDISALVHHDKHGVITWDHTNATYRAVISSDLEGTWPTASFSISSSQAWVYLTGVANTSALIAYKNGMEINNTPHSKSITVNIANALIAKDISNAAFSGIIDEVRISNNTRSPAWIKATYYSNWNDLITFSEVVFAIFTFSNPTPTDLSTVYGLTEQLYLTTTISGTEPSYTYDATFYYAYDDSMINSTVSGIQSGQPSGVIMSTPSGINYSWYVMATSSGSEDTSDTYTFINRFLCSGQTQVSDVPASGIPVRLYLRDTGELIGSDISTTESGVFSIETAYNQNHYIVGLYASTVSGVDITETNALIYDHIRPE